MSTMFKLVAGVATIGLVGYAAHLVSKTKPAPVVAPVPKKIIPSTAQVLEETDAIVVEIMQRSAEERTLRQERYNSLATKLGVSPLKTDTVVTPIQPVSTTGYEPKPRVETFDAATLRLNAKIAQRLREKEAARIAANIPSNVDVFRALMTEFDIFEIPELHEGDPAIGPTGYFDQPDRSRTYWGVDGNGRVYINIAVTAEGMNAGKAFVKTRAFTVFQRYTDDTELFVLGGDDFLYPMGDVAFFAESDVGTDGKFQNLRKLLSGETLRFADTVYTRTGAVADETTWISITMVRD